jgi:2-polyprenyl-3-methyl-5-hydroxy-6-metoxy-1,4-benzoquinol methylase
VTASKFSYVGDELSIFAGARHWKRYIASQIAAYVCGHVLEVGAGMGATTEALWQNKVIEWTSLEPDPALAREARAAYLARGLGAVTVRTGTLASLDQGERFDAILYIDVLEHIADDVAEAAAAARHLKPGGHLIVLAPAHQWLFSPFDAAIGHHRRYNARSLRQTIPRSLTEVRLRYMDAVGVAASVANRALLRQPVPSHAQVHLWDRLMVPASRVLDPLAGFKIGKSVLGVWRL